MKHFLDTMKFSLRLMAKSPANAVLCILVLAGCIALVTSMFRLCYVSFLWRFPYKDSGRIVALMHVDGQGKSDRNWKFKTAENILEDKNGLFSDYIPEMHDGDTVKSGDAKTVTGYCYIKHDFGRIMGVEPIMGRSFAEEDGRADAGPVALISKKIWQETFNSDPKIIGRVLTLMRRQRTIIGVLPDTFRFPSRLDGNQCNIWMPLNVDLVKKETGWADSVEIFAVLAPGVSLKQAQRQFSEEVLRIAAALPDENPNVMGGKLARLNGGYVPENMKNVIAATSACALLLLLMGCGIVSGLLSARYSARLQEFAIRSALGATRGRIIGQMLAEFLLVSVVSVILGLLLDVWFENSFTLEFYKNCKMPNHFAEMGGGWPFVFVASVMCVATLVPSLMPAIRASGTDVISILRESTRTGSSLRATRLSNFVIASQVALACVVLCGGAILACKIADMHDDEQFFDPDQYLCVQCLFSNFDQTDSALRRKVCTSILSELRKNPEITKAGITTEIFGRSDMNSAWGSSASLWIEGATYASDNDMPKILMRTVSPGYFASIDVPILKGRDFNEEDETHTEWSKNWVAAVTDTFAKKYLGDGDPLGRRFKLWGKDGPLFSVVAVVPDIYKDEASGDGRTGVFVPYSYMTWDGFVVYIKGVGSPEKYHQFLDKTIRSVNGDLSIFRITSMRDMRDEQSSGAMLEFVFKFFAFFAAGAMVMIAGGLFGVISLSIGLRRTEIGIRSALGATPGQVVGLLVQKGAWYVTAGLCAGGLGTVFLRYELAGSFDGTLSDNWMGYSVVVAAILVVATVAMIIPAERAARADPSDSLHEE
jgi:putative ABC transport system permease protein